DLLLMQASRRWKRSSGPGRLWREPVPFQPAEPSSKDRDAWFPWPFDLKLRDPGILNWQSDRQRRRPEREAGNRGWGRLRGGCRHWVSTHSEASKNERGSPG